MALHALRTSTLEIAYYDHGPNSGWPVVLSHGFPYDVHAYDEVVPALVQSGARLIVPYLRGFGPTRFLSPSAMRTGQQAALGADLIALLDGLGIEKAIVAGFDWGGVASCVAAALWPGRVSGLVSYAGYDINDRSSSEEPLDPTLESVMWYQHLFQRERGKNCLAWHRRRLCRLLWDQWSPSQSWSDGLFERTAASFDNPDFVDVVINCYRFHMSDQAEGDPSFEQLEHQLALRPKITVPTITLDGSKDPLKPGGSASHDQMFTARHERRVYEVGHAFPMEAPAAFAQAVIDVHDWQRPQST